MPTLFRRAGFWLVAQMLAIAALLAAGGGLVVRLEPDSNSYLDASRQSLGEMLRGERTIGYPLVLRAVAMVSPGWRILPLVQLAAHFAACAAWYFALRRYGATSRQALIAASAVLWLVVRAYENGVDCLLSDSLARSLSILTVAALVWVVASPGRWWPWLVLAATGAATYHVRPAYLFLVPLVPCLGVVLWRLRPVGLASALSWRRAAVGLGVAAILPLLAYCAFRLAAVGHFGLVSFGGYNVIGLAAELIDEDVVEELPASYRPLARAIHAERQRQGLTGERPDYHRWQENYNANIWQVAVPQARKLLGEDPLAVNRELSGLSRAVIGLRPGVHLQYLRFRVRQGFKEFLEGRVFTVLAGAALALYLARLLVDPRRTVAPPPPGVRDAVVWIALSFALAKLLLVTLVEIPLPRYVEAAGTFLPAVAGLLLLEELARLRRPVG